MKRTQEFLLVWVSTVLWLFAVIPAACFAADFYLHTATADIIDNIAPTATEARFKDSPALTRSEYREIGIWSGAPLGSAMRLDSLGELRAWVGLQSSGDQGTQFDLRAEIRRNGIAIAAGESTRISGITHVQNLAREVTVSFGAISTHQFAAGDVLSVRVLAKVADSGGRNGASGLRLYYDAVGRASRFRAIFVPSVPLITIQSPLPGAVISDHQVLVVGRFDTSLGEVGINVNGYVALQDGDEFAAFVPVNDQTTSITAAVSDPSGTSLGSHAIPVTVQLPSTEPVLTFRPFPAMAVVSQPVGFTLISLNEISQIELDGNGDGTINFTGTSLDGVTVTFAEPGIYLPTVRVTDANSTVYTATALVQILEIGQIDLLLQAKWNGMKSALRVGDTATAATYVVKAKQSFYQNIFNNLTISFSAIDEYLPTLTFVEQWHNQFEYEITRTEGPDLVTYMVLFAIDEDGVWRIKFF
jgi:hypothetical protein